MLPPPLESKKLPLVLKKREWICRGQGHQCVVLAISAKTAVASGAAAEVCGVTLK